MKATARTVLVVVLSMIGLSVLADKIVTPISAKFKSAQPQDIAGGNMGGCAGCSRG